MLYKVIKTKQIERLKIFFLLIFVNVIYANNFNKIDILGNHPAKLNLLNKAKKFLNKDMNKSSILEIYTELSNKLQDDGYITAKLNIVEGNINDGNIIFDIESGKIGKIYFYDKTFSPRMIKTAFDIKEGDEFNIKHLDQGIDNLNIGGKDYKLEIVDSDKKNYSDVIIYDNSYKYPNFINMTLDNSPGSPYTKLELATQKYNLLNLNDTLGVSIITELLKNENAVNALKKMDELNKLEQETLKELREKDVDIDDLDDIEGYNKEQKQLIENYKAIRNGLNDTRMDFFAEKTKLIAKNTLNSGGTIYFALDGLATDSTRYNKEKTKIDFEKLDELFDHNNKFYNSVTSKEMRYLYDNFKDHPNIKFTIKDQVIENPFKTIKSKKMVD